MTKFKSLRNKFVRTMLLVTGIIGISTLAIVIVTSVQASSEHLKSVQRYIEEGITSKGMVLTQNHALALRSLTLDNAFTDMQTLIERSVKEDADLLYGMYVNSERETLAFAQRDAPPSATLDREAFRKLGLEEAELVVKSPRWAPVHRLGQDLLEVAAPVVGEDGEVIGTLRYGLSTRRMREALVQAKADARRRLINSGMLVGSLLSLTILLSLILSRIQAVRITRPVGQLTQMARDLASGDRTVRVEIASNDELELLGSSFNAMVTELDSTYRNLEEMNRTLEQKVAARTAELADKNRDMRLVLDNVDQGFVTLSPDGTMSRQRSAALGAWFGAGTESIPFWDYIAPTSEAFAAGFQLGWDQIKEGFLPLEVCLAVLPERLAVGARTFNFRYLPFYKDDTLAGVLVVIADITERLAREREDAEHQELMAAFKRLMQDRTGFELFMREAGGLVDAVCTRRLEREPVTLQRTLHTLKGNSASMGLPLVAELCHSLEEQLAEFGSLQEETTDKLARRFTSITEQLATSGAIFGDRFIEVSEPEYAAVLSDLSELGEDHRDLLDRVRSWRYEPAEKQLQRLANQARALARRLSKGEINVEVAAECVRLPPDDWAPFFSELIHVVRNAVDHGLESPEERARLGKPREGTLVFRAVHLGKQLTFEVADDGAGVDWDAIARKAKARGLPHTSQAELLKALCSDGISTREEATMTSGRGVGMASFQQWVSSHRGRLEVRTKRGEGTTWLIHLPFPLSSEQRAASGVFRSSPPPAHSVSSARAGNRA